MLLSLVLDCGAMTFMAAIVPRMTCVQEAAVTHCCYCGPEVSLAEPNGAAMMRAYADKSLHSTGHGPTCIPRME